jgi:Glycosyl transferases group 1
VTCLGRVPRTRIIEELAAADVVVLPSRWPENEPVVLLEAIAAGRAQLATDIGGIPQLVQPGVTGELVPPANAAALAAAMAAYIQDPGQARRQGEASRARRASLSESMTIDALERMYAEIIGGPLSPGPGEPLVLCAGDWPLPEVAEICNLLHRVEPPDGRVRLAWHGWAEPENWQHAALLWNWSSGADHAAIQRAVRLGIPILAPADCAMAAGLETSFGAALTYDTPLEGKMALARAPWETPAVDAIRRRTQLAADLIAASAPAIRYHLPAPSIIA